MLKEKIYDFVASNGIYWLQKLFPEYYAKEPLGLTDRCIEYPWAIRNIKLYQSMLCPIKILDVGCSGSMFPFLIKAMGYEVYGNDIRKLPTGIEGYQGDIQNTPYDDNTFDIITAISTVEHIGLKGRYGIEENKVEIFVFNEIHRILKNGGIFLMTVPFDKEFRTEKFNRVYDELSLKILLRHFIYNTEFKDSPEGNYKLALIRAIK